MARPSERRGRATTQVTTGIRSFSDLRTPLRWTTLRISDGWGCASSLFSVLQLLGRANEFRVHGVALRELLWHGLCFELPTAVE